MPNYAFGFKKDDVIVEIQSTDSGFVYNQMSKWFGEDMGFSEDCISKLEHIGNQHYLSKDKEISPNVSVADVPVYETNESIEVDNIIPETNDYVSKNIQEVSPKDKEEKRSVQKKFDSDMTEEKTEDSESVSEYKSENVVKSVEKTLENVAKVAEEVSPEHTVLLTELSVRGLHDIKLSEEPLQENDDLKFIKEEVISHKEDNPRELFTPEKTLNLQEDKFYKILKEKFSNLPDTSESSFEAETPKAKVTSLAEFKDLETLINAKSPQNLIDYLIIAAYYLKHLDMLDRYSLKQINAKILFYSRTPINHSIIQEAVSFNYLEVVPDYTGMADVTEYSITPEGEAYLINEL